MNRPRAQQGQVMLFAMLLLLVSSLLLLGLMQAGLMVREKIRLQTAADLAVLSALNAQANGLNAIATGNRAILAQDALAARLNAMVSESAFYRRLLEGVGWLVRVIPYGGPLLGPAVTRGGKALEEACRAAARAGIPAVGPADAILAAQNQAVRISLVPLPLSAARESVKVNAPRADISFLSRLELTRQGKDLAQGISPLPEKTARSILEKTLDRHTRRRDWKVAAGTLPVRKTGGTALENKGFRAFDRLEFKTFSKGRWKWKSIISTSSAASAFGYRRHGVILGIDETGVPAGLTLFLSQKNEFPVPVLAPLDFPITAVSSGRLVYRREGKPQEKPNLLNPFWTTRLIPVASEKGARRVAPPAVLAGILH